MNYYCLIAGLPDIHQEDTKTTASLAEWKTDLLEQLNNNDAALLRLLFAKYDNDNLLTYLVDKDADLNSLGNLTTEDWEQLIQLMQEAEHPNDERLLGYVPHFYHSYNDEKVIAEGLSREDYLSSLYYQYAMTSDNEFLRKWFGFNLDVNNILTAITCRKHGFDPRKYIIGSNEIAHAIRHSNARDFGLAGMFDQLDLIFRLAHEQDLLEREKKIDALKWAWLEENTFFNYFTVEKVLAFVLRMEMIDRWKLLSVEKGAKVFRQLLEKMKEGLQFEE